MAESLEPAGGHDRPPPEVKILLVDDHPANLLALHALLESPGHTLVDARSGEEALEQLKTNEFAVVLLDVVMPGIGGFGTARAIRGLERSRHLPIIFLTANDIGPAQAEEAYALGAVDVLVKPLVPIALQAKVRGFVDLFLDKQRARQEAEQFRLLVQGTKDYAIFMLDSKGRIVTWNAGAERLKGYRADEIVGQHFSRFYPQEALDRGWPAHELKVAAAEGRFEDEGWRVRKDGTQFWANVVVTALKNDRGELLGFSKVTRDLTERKQAEESARRLVAETTARRVAEENARLIQEQRERLHVTLASIGDAVISTDAQGRVDFLNPVAESLLEWTSQEASGRDLSEVFHIVNEQTRQPVENPALRALREGIIVGLANHTVLISKSGRELPIDDSAAPIRTADGKVFGSVLVFRDITERYRKEAELRAAERRFQAVFNQQFQFMAILDCEGAVVDANETCFKATGVTRDQVLGRLLWETPWFDRIPEVPSKWKSIVAQTASGAAPISSEMPYALSDGRVRLAATVTSGLTDGGQVVNLIVEGRDVTEKKAQEQALLDNDRRKDEFLATLAHELRNPMAPIRNSLQILKMPRIDPDIAQQTREVMERQVHHLVRLVDDLLDVSRVMRGKIELRREPVELATVIARAVETAKPLIEVQGHALDIAVPNESLLLDADPVRLAQIVGNLLTNSAKYTDANGRIWLTARREGDRAILSVRDTGIGIAADMLPHVFELFVQADHASTKAQGGLGIGLTLVKNLVEMHGGSVEAHSPGLGQGSEFIVRLPLIAKGTQSAGATPFKPSHPAVPSSGLRLLVVDDNRDAAVSLSMLLRLQGHDVRIAHDGPTALEIARQSRPDVIFLDLGMPGMDGYEVARRLRQQPGLEKVVLAALTGWGQHEDRRRTAEAGFDHHLVKPPEPKLIESLLSDLKWTSRG